MHDLGFNKIAAAILATALGFMLIKEASHMVMHIEAPDTPAYRIAIPEVDKSGPAEPLPFPQADWVAAMDAERGAKVFKKCTSCHNADEGGKNGTGPNLWNIVGNSSAAKAGFAYSGALKNSGISWDYETLDGFLTKPSKYLSGTNMNFVGIKKAADRAAVIEYLRVNAPTPGARPTAIVSTPDAPAEASGDIVPMEASGETIENVTGNVQGGEIVDKTVDKVVETSGEVMETVTEAGKDVVDAAKDVVKDVAEGAEEVAGNVKDKAKNVMEKAEDVVEDAVKDE